MIYDLNKNMYNFCKHLKIKSTLMVNKQPKYLEVNYFDMTPKNKILC